MVKTAVEALRSVRAFEKKSSSSLEGGMPMQQGAHGKCARYIVQFTSVFNGRSYCAIGWTYGCARLLVSPRGFQQADRGWDACKWGGR